MIYNVLKAKLHHIRVTQAEKEYEGSLTVDEDLMDTVGIINYEKILVANLDNGERFETYAIIGERGSGVCCLNGAAAYKGKIGDRLIVMNWCGLDEEETKTHEPKIVRLDENNKIVAAAV
ncbi:MAG: aspartate 1-decarboxylase [Kiritimatiellia bacterium]